MTVAPSVDLVEAVVVAAALAVAVEITVVVLIHLYLKVWFVLFLGLYGDGQLCDD